MSPYRHTYIPTHLHTYLPTYLHTYTPTYLLSYIFVHTNSTYFLTYILTHLHTYIPIIKIYVYLQHCPYPYPFYASRHPDVQLCLSPRGALTLSHVRIISIPERVPTGSQRALEKRISPSLSLWRLPPFRPIPLGGYRSAGPEPRKSEMPRPWLAQTRRTRDPCRALWLSLPVRGMDGDAMRAPLFPSPCMRESRKNYV